MTTSIGDPLTLPCGATLPNRLAKAAMTEGMATAKGVPTPELERLYGLWSDGGAGLLLTGNVMIDRHHLERPGNVIVEGAIPNDGENGELMVALKKWAAAATKNGNHCWVQISHPGRQVQKKINPNPKAPSAVKLDAPAGLFGDPLALDVEEIEELTTRFAMTAKTVQSAGFTGVEIHAAHGYLLSSFLSPRVNQRDDNYGGSLENRARFLLNVVRKTREQVGPNFPIAVKLNSADFQKGGFNFEDSLIVVKWLEDASVDLVEISGGTYEQLAFLNVGGKEEKEVPKNHRQSTIEREAYFVDFAKAMQDTVNIPLMVTGGFRTRQVMRGVVESGEVDLIGLGRPMCIMTDAPKKLLEGELEVLPRQEDSLALLPWWLSFLNKFHIVSIMGTFAIQFWFYEQLYLLGKSGEANSDLSVFSAVIAVDTRERQLIAELEK